MLFLRVTSVRLGNARSPGSVVACMTFFVLAFHLLLSHSKFNRD